MSNLAVREVDFNGDTLIAAQDQTSEKVYVAVKWVCQGIGLTEDQAKRQIKNVKEDLVISKGVSNLTLLTNGGEQDVLCVELDFLPLWLAKISITPKMIENSPDTVNKLVEYQLKAKEVLANAFVRNVTQIVPKSYKEALYALIESVEEKEKLEAEKVKLEEEKQILLPKAESFDDFIDGSNVQNMNTVSKALGYGRNKLYRFLREQKVMMKGNLPYQTYIDRGYFKVKEIPVVNDNIRFNTTQTYVTAKGVDFINKLLKEYNIDRNI